MHTHLLLERVERALPIHCGTVQLVPSSSENDIPSSVPTQQSLATVPGWTIILSP